MSRIGKQPIALPAGVTVTAETDGLVTVTGPKGTLSRRVSPRMEIKVEGTTLSVVRPTDSDDDRAQHGLVRTLVNNMVVGVSAGYQKVLNVTGVGYRATIEGGNLVLNVGYSHSVTINPRPGITFSAVVDPATRMPVITVAGIDKEIVGQQSAEVRKVRKPEPYKGKGIRYSDEIVRRKAGKSGKAGKGGKKK
ncbi:50S ribosomal protein L6 [Armatimonas rosea]|uniref:Large ribosomal subunit protein uL6 n=1 Tax=Armatimonas rosea TaxID=685828 RepID=A0A7W9W8R2_ARMRO|nr:50S ribosomal protein L6 [Armatimonas rosea]MBB6053013.1 large subunit ribosomal protein L6 [Armatimonas rosea]